MYKDINQYPMYLYMSNIKMHAKVVNIRAKIKQTKTNMQTIKQAKLIPTRQGVPQWSCHPKMGCAREASSDDGSASFLGRRQTVAGVILGVAGKTRAWLVAETTIDAWWRKRPKWWSRGEKEKLGREMIFS
jgi:hypothetical protein